MVKRLFHNQNALRYRLFRHFLLVFFFCFCFFLENDTFSLFLRGEFSLIFPARWGGGGDYIIINKLTTSRRRYLFFFNEQHHLCQLRAILFFKKIRTKQEFKRNSFFFFPFSADVYTSRGHAGSGYLFHVLTRQKYEMFSRFRK